jgi:hypothetical protein
VSIETAGDRLALLTILGEDVIVNGAPLKGVVDDGFVDTLEYGEGTGPQVIVRTSDVPSVAQGQPVTMRDIAYRISSVRPDGTGMTTLLCERI